MIHLVYSNRTEELAAALVEHLRALRAAGGHPLEPVNLVVPNRNLEAYLRFRIAEALGVAANLRFRRLERFVEERLAASTPRFRLLDHSALEGAVLAVLQSLGEEGELGAKLAPLDRYVKGSETEEGRELRQAQLASRLAHLFEEYDLSRSEMVSGWLRGPQLAGTPAAHLEGWQRALWLRLFGPEGLFLHHPPAGADGWLTVGQLARGGGPSHLLDQGPLLVFGFSYVARAYQQLLARLAREGELVLYTLNPCQELWEDVETPGEHRRRLRRARQGTRGELPSGDENDPFGLFSDTDNPPLRLWGRPGREGMRLFEELTDCDFQGRFQDPLAGGCSLLRRLQHDILERQEERAEPPSPPMVADATVKLLPCPSVRREVEAVAEEIWRLIVEVPAEGTVPLRFSDIAVIVNAASRERYLPQIEATFDELHGIPRSVTDLPLVGERRLAEGARLLLELPFGRFSRSELLKVMTHPAVTGRFDDLVPGRWARLADDLGIRFGGDPQELQGTYLEQDVVTWDQGIRRLALGAFLTGERSGDSRILETGDGAYLAHELPAGALAPSARFGLLARSLLADAQAIRRQRRALSHWAAAFRTLFQAYLFPADEGEERDLSRCLTAMQHLEAMDVTGEPVSGRVATWAATRALARLAGTRGSFLADGVVVSSFLPMRAIPFRVIFVLGLGEGRFPAANRRDAMDLRATRRLPGDVSPAERDRYMFLETLLSARDRLCLSWVARDEHSGEPLHPSGVLQELEHLLAREYLGKEGLEALTFEPPVHRFEGVELEPRGRRFAVGGTNEAPPAPPLPGARAEAAARRLGAAARDALPELPAQKALERLRLHLDHEDWVELARFLGLPQLPPPASSELGRAAPLRSLALTSLRGLLECPLQAAAKVVLGLEQEGEEDPASGDDEPLAPGRLDEVALLREVMGQALRRNEDPVALYHQVARHRRLGGTLPAGLPGEIATERHLATLEAWQQALEARQLDQVTARRLRIGPAPELEDVDGLLPALEVTVPGAGSHGGPIDSPGGSTEREILRLHGPSPLLLGVPSRLLYFEPNGSGPLEGRPRLLVRIFFDHLALAAAGVGNGEGRIALVLRGAKARPVAAEIHLRELAIGEAGELLATVAADLLGQIHDAPLACEAVFKAWKKASRDLEALDGELLVQEILRGLGPFGRSSSLYGPIRNPQRHPPPPPELAAHLARQRFAPLFRLLHWEGR